MPSHRSRCWTAYPPPSSEMGEASCFSFLLANRGPSERERRLESEGRRRLQW
ncbi:hypothetical protein LINPERPRIM_LOCUS41108 [Linum perenne]